MILKVKTMNRGKEGWLVMGEITDVHWNEDINDRDYDQLSNECTLGDYLLFEAPERHVSEPIPPAPCRLITFSDKDGDQRKVLFNTVAYLMNNDGKTVETIDGQ